MANTREETFGEFVESMLPTVTAKFENPKHRQQWANTFFTYAKPKAIWGVPISMVTTQHVSDVLVPIWREKRETASRLRGRIENMIDRAAAVGKFDPDKRNPASWGIQKHIVPELTAAERKPNHRTAMDYERMPEFWQSLSTRHGAAADCMRLVILSGLRTSEVKGATWSEFDLKKRIWYVPGERMKMRVPHEAPITTQMLELLMSLPGKREGLVFRNPEKGNELSENAMLALIKRMRADALNSKGERVTVHGFRSTFRDWLGDCTDFDESLGEDQLAHAKGKVERAYRRGTAVERRREVMQAYADFVSGKAPMTRLTPSVVNL